MTRKNQKILNDRKQIKILGTIKFVDMPSKVMTEQAWIDENGNDRLNEFYASGNSTNCNGETFSIFKLFTN